MFVYLQKQEAHPRKLRSEITVTELDGIFQISVKRN